MIAGETEKARRHTGAPDGAVAAVVVVATATATPIVDDAEPAAHILVLVKRVVESWWDERHGSDIGQSWRLSRLGPVYRSLLGWHD